MRKKIPETPKQGAPEFERVSHHVVGSNILALEAAAKEARNLGYETVILSSMIEGETRDVARVHSAIGKEIVQSGYPLPSPACVVSGGETTVTVRGRGLGGRNQEFCLAVALDLEGFTPRIVVLSGGTDGNDGPTDAAGAIVDPLTVRRGAEQGMRGRDFLLQNDAYNFLQQTGDLLLTGPTNTNVMDVRIVLVR
jgi:hydroxypyruvate reductase